MYIFGPVPSRRLGLSLGVDLIAGRKACNNDCIYCELGRTPELTNERKVFVKTQDVLAEIKKFFEGGGTAEYVTFSGSGEPTLALNLDEVMAGIRGLTDTKTALLTNSLLFYDEQVRKEAAGADLVMPSIDAGAEDVFEKINRPHKSIVFKKMVQGLIDFSKEYKGEIKPEVLVVKGFNDSDSRILEIKNILDSMDNVTEIQVNTVVRSRAENYAEPVEAEKLEHIKNLLGGKAIVIGTYSGKQAPAGPGLRDMMLSGLKKRPMTINDLSLAFKAPKSQITILAEKFVSSGELEKETFEGKVFYKAK